MPQRESKPCVPIAFSLEEDSKSLLDADSVVVVEHTLSLEVQYWEYGQEESSRNRGMNHMNYRLIAQTVHDYGVQSCHKPILDDDQI